MKKNASSKHKYLVSVIMPVYNVEPYLAEAIDSILKQTIGFKKNCEIILVNDGSTDNSERVCLEYEKRFPKNITYIKQKNLGPGAARNKGTSLARGKYISMPDADDKLSADTFEKACKFLDENHEKIDLVGIKFEFFEAKTGTDHPLNYRFTKDRIVNLESEFTSFQGSVAPAIFKAEIFKEHKFNPKAGKWSEDLRFMGEVLLDKMAYGVIVEPTYYYRKRLAQTSSQDSNKKDKFWYLESPKRVLEDLFEYVLKNNNNQMPKYIQSMVMYDLGWRFKQPIQSTLSKAEETKYKNELIRLLKKIDDDVILAQRHIDTNLKLFILNKKYGFSLLNQYTQKNGIYYLDSGIPVYDYSKEELHCTINIFEILNNKLNIEGYLNAPILDGAKIGFLYGDGFLPAELINRPHREHYSLGDVIPGDGGFKISLPIKFGDYISPALLLPSGKIRKLSIRTTFSSRLTPYKNGLSYRVMDKLLVSHIKPETLFLQKYSPVLRFKKELRYSFANVNFQLISRIINKFKKHHTKAVPQPISHNSQAPSVALRIERSKKNNISNKFLKLLAYPIKIYRKLIGTTVFIRFCYFLVKPFYKKPVWLVMDRTTAADDNGEVFFRFLSKQPKTRFNAYFVLSKQSPEFKGVKKYGKVVNFFSLRHKLLMLLADKVISSEAAEYNLNPFYGRGLYLADLMKYDFVFLQHGIIRDDISSWLNKYKKNIKLFITTAKPEYKSVVEGNYGYTSKEVVLTGLPRLDNLINAPKGKLILMPTWRANLAGSINPENGVRYYNKDFKKSDFFNFYHKLINDKRIIDVLKNNNMIGELYLHPSFQSQIHDFKGSDGFKIMEFPFDYSKAKSEGNLLVTDYSSVALDFAYLKKPIIYAQFDEDTYYDSGVSSQGYLSYEKAGLGPVVYNYEDTVKTIMSSIEDGCVMSSKYVKRAEKFFDKFDHNNCERVYEAILNMNDGSAAHVDRSVKKPLRYLSVRRRNKNTNPVNLYWWRYRYPLELNFGDEITQYILESIYGLKSIWQKPSVADLAGAGSIIDILEREAMNNDVKIWGSGYIREGEKNQNNHLDFYAVRGPKSLSRIDSSREVVMGDPGLLANLVFRRSKKKRYKVGVVAHYVDKDSPILDTVRNNKDYLIIDPLQTPDKVALDITSCEYIFSSSMHGLIFADSFKVPNNWMPLSDKLAGGDYKFEDYYLSTGRDTIKVSADMLTDLKAIKNLKHSYRKVKDLKNMQRNLINNFPKVL